MTAAGQFSPHRLSSLPWPTNQRIERKESRDGWNSRRTEGRMTLWDTGTSRTIKKMRPCDDFQEPGDPGRSTTVLPRVVG
jgi:hypothetical protein